jgi:hypothetical protein
MYHIEKSLSVKTMTKHNTEEKRIVMFTFKGDEYMTPIPAISVTSPVKPDSIGVFRNSIRSNHLNFYHSIGAQLPPSRNERNE